MRTASIPVTDLAYGDVIAPNVVVKTIDPCTSRGKIHVNGKYCYELVGYAEIWV